MIKTTKTPATKTTATKSVKVAKKPAVKTTAPAVKAEPAKTTAPAVKAEPAKTTAPAVKAEVSVRVVKGSSWEELKDCRMHTTGHATKSLVGQFIIEFAKDDEFTGEELAKAFMTQFKTKSGITPDEKWARRNVKLFVDKGVIMCELDEEDMK